MNEWIDDLSALAAAGVPAVLVTVASVRGSAPREAGAKMIVTPDETIGTIGGGQLEYRCTRAAVDMLDGGGGARTQRFPLGAAMGQCCGGAVEILFEPIDASAPGWLGELHALHDQHEPAALVTRLGEHDRKFVVTHDAVFPPDGGVLPPAIADEARALVTSSERIALRDGWVLEAITGTDFNVAVFGAGHVGTEVVAALAKLDTHIRWVDSRRNVFTPTPPNVQPIGTGEPALEVAAMPPTSFYLVMTHSHALDFEICDRILRRGDAAYCGLIGSTTKRRRFEKRFREQGLGESVIGSLVCPIGIGGITGKKPAEIAIAVAAELLQRRDRAAAGTERDWPANVRPLGR